MVDGPVIAWEDPRPKGAVRLWARASVLACAVAAAVLLFERDMPILALGVLLPAAFLTFADWVFRWRTMTYALILTVLAIPGSIYRLPVQLPFGLDIYRIVLMLLLVLWFGALLADERIRWTRTPLDAPLIVLFTVIGVSLLVNLPELAGGLGYGPTLRRLLYFSTLVLLLYVIVSTVRSTHDARRLISFVIGVGVCLSVLGVVERFTAYNVFQHLESFIPVLQRTAPESGEALMRASGVRVSGSAAHPIAFAAILGMILPLALARLSVAESFVQQATYALSASLIGVAMILTGSRTAFTALIVVSLVLIAGAGKGRNRLLVTLLVVFVAVYIAVPGMLGTMFKWMTPSFIMQQEVDNPAGRIADYSRIAEHFWRRPLLGMGFGAFVPEKFFYVDNQYLKFLAEIGIAGFAAFAWFLLRALHWLFTAARKATGAIGADLLGISAGVAVFTAVCATFDTLGFPQVTYVFFILLSLGAALALSREGEPVPVEAAAMSKSPAPVQPADSRVTTQSVTADTAMLSHPESS